ncbi:uncharacterized protein LOC109840002 [Asparagus officinalis]|uniref:uncharacterized protein LOC109840002 n=1 Tax=Asparagus officinalis TaxID=4686 RepID=UPI00098E3DF4|nr:uncharacterized protein LOC109840002 [Asparagus officinalis]
MECISTPKYSLSINGTLHVCFQGARGLRQGDPLSPYLFVIGMKYLSRRLDFLKEDRLFRFHPKCSRIKITHLLFADDLLLFCKADMNSVSRLNDCLKEFSQVSGLEPNSAKCSLYMSGIGDDLKVQISSYLNFPECVLPIRYLGVPLISKRLSWLDCSPLINKISEQFQSWQNRRTLSYAGRLQLIKSVILGIQIFWTSNYILPIKDLEHGGLRVFSANVWNHASAAKLLWLIHLKKDILWIKWVHGNYLRQNNIWQVQVKENDSWMWKQLLRVRDLLIGKFGNVDNLLNVVAGYCVNGSISISSVYRKINQQAPPMMQHKHMETCEHLYFECQYSATVWNKIMDWLSYRWKSCKWNQLTTWYSNLKGIGFKKKLKRMALSAAVYLIWQERNLRIFQHKARDPEKLFRVVKITIFAKILNEDIPNHVRDYIESL